ncbi:hypothetical protein AKJ09_05224 [Labilithrix luteola]|uniref:Uncharacterized protein n=1 Tax=Labilithrix luteola TaxID=1391654 RepID=A0A0K1PYF6_9BACT|nr:hypothetical protein [Labilithrix luteola]AKU98560.1 hypothetical protein AKJ09_05224 [Labilithrix luteola]
MNADRQPSMPGIMPKDKIYRYVITPAEGGCRAACAELCVEALGASEEAAIDALLEIICAKLNGVEDVTPPPMTVIDFRLEEESVRSHAESP